MKVPEQIKDSFSEAVFPQSKFSTHPEKTTNSVCLGNRTLTRSEKILAVLTCSAAPLAKGHFRRAKEEKSLEIRLKHIAIGGAECVPLVGILVRALELRAFKKQEARQSDQNGDGYTSEDNQELSKRSSSRSSSSSCLISPRIPKTESEFSQLMKACGSNNVDAVAFSIENEINLNEQDANGDTPMHVAVRSKSKDATIALLQAQADKEIKNIWGRTPLHIAAREGNLELVTLLVNDGANLNTKDHEGNTPLQSAINNKHLTVAKFIIAHHTTNNDQDVLSDINQQIEQLKKIRQFSKWVFKPKHHFLDQTNEMIELGLHKKPINQLGETLLMYACEYGSEEQVLTLLEAGADVNSKTESGHSALSIAVVMNRLEIVHILVEKNSNIEVKDALQIALEKFSLYSEIVKLLNSIDNKNQGQEVVKQDIDSELMIAAYKGDSCRIDELLTQGCNPNTLNQTQVTPLMIAAEKGHADIVQKLLEKGARTDFVNKYGETAAQCAQNICNIQNNIINLLSVLEGSFIDDNEKRLDETTKSASSNGKSVSDDFGSFISDNMFLHNSLYDSSNNNQSSSSKDDSQLTNTDKSIQNDSQNEY